MPDIEKFEAALKDHQKDYGHRFGDLANYLLATGWTMRQKGSHVIFTKPGFARLNLQSDSGKAKGYQIRQVRKIIFP